MVKSPFQYFTGVKSYDLQEHIAYLKELHTHYPLNTTEVCEAHTIAVMKQICVAKQPWLILGNFADVITAIYESENIYCTYPPIVHDRDYLTRRQAELTSKRIAVADKTVISTFRALIDELPAVVFNKEKPNGATVPLQSLTTNYTEVVATLIALLMNSKYGDRFTFPNLRATFTENTYRISGMDINKKSSRKLLTPTDYDGDAADFLVNTPLADFFNTQVPFHIPQKTFASHGIILAPPNHGKTQLLGSLVASFLADSNSPGLFVLDPHGDLYANLLSRVDPSRLVILDPDANPPPLNFLDFGNSTEAQTLQTFSYLMSSLSGGLSDKQGAIVPYLLKLLRAISAHQHTNIETLRQIIDEKAKGPDKSKFAAFIASLPSVDQGFFHNQFYNSRMQETKDAIGWKLYSALSSDAFRQMFSAKTNSFDADAAMRDRKVVIAKGARNSLGDDGMKVFLQFLVAQFFSAALRRERIDPSHRYLCLLFVDEAHHVFNSQTSNILTECRKYGLGFVAATQVVQQIPEDVKAAIYGATAIKIAGPVSHSDANILSREMYTTPDFIRSMKALERSHADWAFYVSGMTDKAVRVRVPYGQLEALPVQKQQKMDTSQKQRGDTEVSPSQPATVATGVPDTSKTISQNRESASKAGLSDIELVITISRRIETLLESRLGAKGRGLHEKITSVADSLPTHLVRPAYYVAFTRNNVLHKDGFEFRHSAKFLRLAKLVEDHLTQIHDASADDDPATPGKGTG